MVKKISVSCTQCKQTCELYISISASIIMICCPECTSPILYYNKEQLLNDEEGAPFASHKHLKNTVERMIKRISARQHNTGSNIPLNCNPCKASSLQLSGPACHGHSMVATAEHKNTISQDDITDLQIDLALCNDVTKFIEHL